MDSKDGRLLFGIETELGFTASDARAPRPGSQTALDKLLSICRDKLAHLPGQCGSRIYLANGCLIYPDVGHPELATAESGTPKALLASLRAVEAQLAEAARELAEHDEMRGVSLFRHTVDYANGNTWGCHESYLARREPWSYAAKVVPHLVSRVVFTGSGGFNNTYKGAEFALSPRVFHLSSVSGAESGGGRAIFSLRDEALANEAYYRVHLVCGDANASELSTYLKVGTTALVLAMADAGVDFGFRQAWLSSPRLAMRGFTRDFRLRERMPCNDGRARSAIDIQRHFVALAHKYADARFMPPWAGEVIESWQDVLNRLETDPRSLAGWLDWPTKLGLFERYVERSSLDWQALTKWTRVAAKVSASLGPRGRVLSRLDAQAVRSTLNEPGETMSLFAELDAEQGGGLELDWDEYAAFQRLRDELCELDVRYGQLYPAGIFAELDAQGLIQGGLVTPEQVEQAKRRPPEPGRARLRGDWIARLAGEQGLSADWTHIRRPTAVLDLTDPFVEEAQWRHTNTLAALRSSVRAAVGRNRSASEASEA